jgi:hypothetical protein
MDLSDPLLIVEMSMWANAPLKKALSADETYFGLADGIGFEQVMVNDIIVTGQVRRPEYMKVLGFDEANQLILVERGWNSTPVASWKKGTNLRIFRAMSKAGRIETEYADIQQEDGTTENKLVKTYLAYDWDARDTCVPGCFWVEFKLLQMSPESVTPELETSLVPSFTPVDLTETDFACTTGEGVEWVRRFPESADGFLIRIVDSPTAEL